MKKSILLFSACLVAGLAQAQRVDNSVLFGNAQKATVNTAQQHLDETIPARFDTKYTWSGARTTTTSGGRWYNFAQLEDTMLSLAGGGPGAAGGSLSYLWATQNSIWPYGSTTAPTYQANNEVANGTIFDPKAPGFNMTAYYDPSLIAINSSTAYQVDSVSLEGIYKRNPATPGTVVDTVRVAYTTSPNFANWVSWGFTSTYGADSIYFKTLYFDSLRSIAAQKIGTTTPVYTVDLILHAADTTAGNSVGVWTLGFPVLNVPANQLVGASVTFISGDPAASGSNRATFADTVRRSNNTYKYGSWRQYFIYNNLTGAVGPEDVGYGPTSAVCPSCGLVGWNMGQMELEPSFRTAGTQMSMFASVQVTSTSGSVSTPTTDQYPSIGFHVICGACLTVGAPSLAVHNVTDLSNINVVPNPANNYVAIMFNQAASATAEVTLTNTLGQQVAAQSVSNGKALFSTTSLPAGIYVYSIKVDGQSATGRVVVAH